MSDRPATSGAESLYAFVDRLMERHQKPEEAAEQLEEWLLFDLAGKRFCLPVECVIEVVRVRPVTRIPGAPPQVKGLFNLHGRALPLVDLGEQLHLGPSREGAAARIVVLESRGRRIGVLVDRARRLVKIAPSTVGPPEETESPIPSTVLRGVHRAEAGSWILLEPDHLLLTEGVSS